MFVDYAHKPDALAKALEALRPLSEAAHVALQCAGPQSDAGPSDAGAPAAEAALLEDVESRFDLLVLDRMMPRLDGMETCRRLRQVSQVPIIMLTAFDDPANKLIGKLQGRVFRYLTKPFVPDVLVQTVKEAVASQAERVKTA